MAIPATQLRPGMIIKHNNDLHSVFSVEHRTPGNLRAFIQAKLRNLRVHDVRHHLLEHLARFLRQLFNDLGAQFAFGRWCRQQMSDHGEAQLRPSFMDSRTWCLLSHAGVPCGSGHDRKSRPVWLATRILCGFGKAVIELACCLQ